MENNHSELGMPQDCRRKHFLDNIRWVTVLLVLFFHVIYYYHAKGGYYGTIGGFKDRQWQDLFMYMIYPWFMMLLFLVAGISSKYSLNRQSDASFLRNRSRKLLLPCTLGLVFVGWVWYYYLVLANGEQSTEEPVFSFLKGIDGLFSLEVKVMRLIGHLWFIVDLWLFSVLIVFVRRIEKGILHKKIGIFFAKHDGEKSIKSLGLNLCIIIGGWILVWASSKFSSLYLFYAYRTFHPINYFTAFLLGYFVFSHDDVQNRVMEMRIPILVLSIIANALFSVKYWKSGTIVNNPQALGSVLGSFYVWMTMLTMLGCFKAWANKTNRFATYMSKASYGMYVIHYLAIAVVGYYTKRYLSLPPWASYAILITAVMFLSALLYEIIRRIPFVRWCVFGMNVRKDNRKPTKTKVKDGILAI